MLVCTRCGRPVSREGEDIYRQRKGQYPLLCDICLLAEMDMRITERRFCVSCGNPLSPYRLYLMVQIKRQGGIPLRLCFNCLRKYMDKTRPTPTIIEHNGPEPSIEHLDESEQDFAIELNHEWVCPRCLTPLSSANLDRLNNGRLAHCDYCGIWMRPEPFTGGQAV
jgi:DNA-directed RNA polymerase subunit RPC12/RpoP